jgi:hypothetical protein
MTKKGTTSTDEQVTENVAEDYSDLEQRAARQAAEEAAQAQQPLLARLFRSVVVRFLVFVVIAIVVLLIVANTVYSSMRAQRSQKIPVEIYPNALLVSKRTTSVSDNQVYSTTDSFQVVYDFYDSRIRGAGADDTNGCKQIDVSMGTLVPDEPAKIVGRCLVYDSILDADQLLSVQISYEADPGGKSGKTMIVIERTWRD